MDCERRGIGFRGIFSMRYTSSSAGLARVESDRSTYIARASIGRDWERGSGLIEFVRGIDGNSRDWRTIFGRTTDFLDMVLFCRDT